ncbi:hypothetical protein DEJ23_12230 [Curtobacterium sp. MCSS17_008]|uniref:hypothetical protein n=1 Tax=Curtobacterium sp. MCSS17_008 TaxID=2175647 RepID=UPI000DA92EA3|nr:hypothetical protein [Curtobacterium sp. MCSS17_008]PZF55258.1 hypothetical protein DEJ23_12230 [Curtobacterium sp. MCSS17_008]
MVEIIDGIDDGTNRVSAVILDTPGKASVRLRVRGERPSTLTYAGSTWASTDEMVDDGEGHLAYRYRQSQPDSAHP